MDDLPRKDYRCTCSSRRRLASYGVDKQNKLFIHVKVYKAERVYGEIVVQGLAVVRLRCPACSRWHVINITNEVKPPIMEVDRSVAHTYPNDTD